MSWVPPLHFNLVRIAVEILGERNVQMHGNVFFGLFGVQKVGPAWIHPSNWPSSDCTRNFTEADVCWANIVVWNVDIIESLWLCHIKITYWPLCFTNKRPQCWLICSAIQDSLYRWDKTRPCFFYLAFMYGSLIETLMLRVPYSSITLPSWWHAGHTTQEALVRTICRKGHITALMIIDVINLELM